MTVGDNAFLGIGSSVVPDVTLGRDAMVGAGAVVISDVPPGATVVGVPAKAISRLLRTSISIRPSVFPNMRRWTPEMRFQ